MKLRWHRSYKQYTETRCGKWCVIPIYWGAVTACAYGLRRGLGYGEHQGKFATQSEAKQRAQQIEDEIKT